MPCRDQWPTPEQEDRFAEIRDLRKRNDLLAAETCATRALMLRMFATHKNWPADIKRAMKDVEAKQREHREMDRLAALRKMNADLRKVKDAISKIKALGGVPSTKQLVRRRNLIAQIKQAKTDDPLTTTIY